MKRIRGWLRNLKWRLLEADPHNCLLFCVQQIIQHPEGYIVMRKSDWTILPHFLFTRDLRNYFEYTPLHPNHHLILPPPFYLGCVRHTTPDNLKRRKIVYSRGVEVAHRDFKGYV